MACAKHSVILIIGLPGSGKTTLAQHYVEQGYTLIDDPKTLDDIPFDRSIVITDVLSCDPLVFDGAMAVLNHCFANVRVIAFENDWKQCYENVIDRGDKTKFGCTSTIKRLSEVYKPEELGVEIVPVYRK